ncbi:hypothetical protein EEAAV_26310 (plasmid) [Rahnella aceris]
MDQARSSYFEALNVLQPCYRAKCEGQFMVNRAKLRNTGATLLAHLTQHPDGEKTLREFVLVNQIINIVLPTGENHLYGAHIQFDEADICNSVRIFCSPEQGTYSMFFFWIDESRSELVSSLLEVHPLELKRHFEMVTGLLLS